jgi:quinol monooxygenase YgiN
MDDDMWAQIITVRIKPGAEDRIAEMTAAIRAAEQPGSGLLRSTVARDQADPTLIRMMVVFESEEHARAREQDERRAEAMEQARAIMGEIFDGPPEFTNLEVLEETVNG